MNQPFPDYASTIAAIPGYNDYTTEQKESVLQGYMSEFAAYRRAIGQPFTDDEIRQAANFSLIERGNINFGFSQEQLQDLFEQGERGLDLAADVVDDFGPGDELVNFWRAGKKSFFHMNRNTRDMLARVFTGESTPVSEAQYEQLASELSLPTREGFSEFAGTVFGSLIPNLGALAVTGISGGSGAPTLIANITALSHMGLSSAEAGIQQGELEAILRGEDFEFEDKVMTALGYAASEVGLEYLRLKSLTKAFSRLGKSVEDVEDLKSASTRAIREMDDDVATRLGRASREGRTAFAKEFGKIIAGQSGREAVQEMGTEVGQILTDILFTPVDQIAPEQVLHRVAQAGAGGAVGGVMLGLPLAGAGGFYGTSKNFRESLDLRDLRDLMKQERDRGILIDGRTATVVEPGSTSPFLGEYNIVEKGTERDTKLDRFKQALLQETDPENTGRVDAINSLRAVEGPEGSILANLQKLVDPLGIDVLFVDEAQGITDAKLVNGLAMPGDPNTIMVNIRAKKPLDYVIGHESFHTLKQRRGASSRLATDIEELINDAGPAYQKYLEEINAARADQSLDPLSRDRAIEEIGADFFGEAFLTDTFWEGVAVASRKKGDMTMMEHLIEAALGVARRFLVALGQSDISLETRELFTNYHDALDKAIDLYVEGSDQAIPQRYGIDVNAAGQAFRAELNGTLDAIVENTFREESTASGRVADLPSDQFATIPGVRETQARLNAGADLFREYVGDLSPEVRPAFDGVLSFLPEDTEAAVAEGAEQDANRVAGNLQRAVDELIRVREESQAAGNQRTLDAADLILRRMAREPSLLELAQRSQTPNLPPGPVTEPRQSIVQRTPEQAIRVIRLAESQAENGQITRADQLRLMQDLEQRLDEEPSMDSEEVRNLLTDTINNTRLMLSTGVETEQDVREFRAGPEETEFISPERTAVRMSIAGQIRATTGLSQFREDFEPSIEQQDAALTKLARSVEGESHSRAVGVLGSKFKRTIGMFEWGVEPSFDAEVLVNDRFNPTTFVAAGAEIARDANQDAAIFSIELAPDAPTPPNARPGVKMTFKENLTRAQAEAIFEVSKEAGIPGITLRVPSSAEQGSLDPDTFSGAEYQWVPEFTENPPTPEQFEQARQEATDQIDDLIVKISELTDIESVSSVFFDTLVLFRENYDDYSSATNRPTDRPDGSKAWFGQPYSVHASQFERVQQTRRENAVRESRLNKRVIGGTKPRRRVRVREATAQQPGQVLTRPATGIESAWLSAENYIAANRERLNLKDPESEAQVVFGRSRKIADEYVKLPKVDEAAAEAYQQLAQEVEAQYEVMTEQDNIDVIYSETDFYGSSAEMMQDLEDNKRMYVFKGGEPHPFMDERDENGVSVTEKFRAVHDYYGHAAEGNEFGPLGEERAWKAHSRMFSPLARRAMTTETRGQNSWVNFGPDMFDKDGWRGDKDHPRYIHPSKRPFAEQKAALLPEGFENETIPGEEVRQSIVIRRPNQPQDNISPELERLNELRERVFAQRTRHPGWRYFERIMSARPNDSDEFGISLIDRWRVAFTDRLRIADAAINYARNLSPDVVLPENDPALLMRLFSSTNALIEEMFDNGVLVAGTTGKRATGGGIEWLLKPFAEARSPKAMKQEMDDAAMLMVSQRVLEKTGQTNLSEVAGITPEMARENIAALKQDPERFARLEEAAVRYRQWADATLRYAVDQGRMSEEQYQWVKEKNMQYVAMQRVQQLEDGDEIVIARPSGTGGKLGNVAQPLLKKFKGKSIKPIENVYESLLSNTHRIVKEADRNEVMRSFVNMMEAGGEKVMETVGRPVPMSETKNTIVIFKDGVPERWQFQSDVLKSLKGLYDVAPLPWIARILPTIFRNSITYSPPFIVRNIIRDTQHRLTVTEGSTKEGLKSSFKKYSQMDVDLLRRFRGDQAGYYYHDRVQYARALDAAIKHHAKDRNSLIVSAEKLGKFSWGNYKRAVEGSERFNRLREFQAAYDELLPQMQRQLEQEGILDPGDIPGRAQYNAYIAAAARTRGLMDFAIAGTITRVINQVLPFTNAHIQGLRRSLKALRSDEGIGPARFFSRWAILALLPSLIVRSWAHANGTDDEYEAMPDYLKDLFWNIKVSPDLWVRIPKNYELGVLTSGVERFISKYVHGNEHAFDGYLGSLSKTLTPADEAAMLGPFKAFGEVIFNYDSFRDRQIVPWYDVGKDIELRTGTDNASLLGRFGQELMQMIGLDEYKTPRKFSDARALDHVIRGQFGTLGDIAIKISQSAEGTSKKTRPLTSAFAGVLANSPVYGSRDVQWIYNIAERRGLPRNAPILGPLDAALKRYFKADNAEDRDRLGEQVRERAASLRGRLEAMQKDGIGVFKSP